MRVLQNVIDSLPQSFQVTRKKLNEYVHHLASCLRLRRKRNLPMLTILQKEKTVLRHFTFKLIDLGKFLVSRCKVRALAKDVSLFIDFLTTVEICSCSSHPQ